MVSRDMDFQGFDLFMKHKLKTSKNLINYEVSLLFFPPQSLPKNMKSELEISLDNEVLDSLSKETPQTPAACQGETGESLTNQDKVKRKMPLLNCSFSFPSINTNLLMDHAISPRLSIKTYLSQLLVVLKWARQ